MSLPNNCAAGSITSESERRWCISNSKPNRKPGSEASYEPSLFRFYKVRILLTHMEVESPVKGPTLNITPFVTHSRSYQDPYEGIYYEPQYDGRDVKGQKVEIQQQVKNYPWEEWYDDRVRTDPNDPLYDVNEDGIPDRWFEDGADMTIVIEDIQPDGIPDRPGKVLWDKPVRTGQKDNLSTNIGLSATMSFPLDGGLQERCKAADTQTALMKTVANKRIRTLRLLVSRIVEN